MFDAAPESLDEDVVEGASPSIHADGYAFSFQYIGEGGAGELRALVAVEDFGRAIVAQGVLQTIDTEHGFQTHLGLELRAVILPRLRFSHYGLPLMTASSLNHCLEIGDHYRPPRF